MIKILWGISHWGKSGDGSRADAFLDSPHYIHPARYATMSGDRKRICSVLEHALTFVFTRFLFIHCLQCRSNQDVSHSQRKKKVAFEYMVWKFVDLLYEYRFYIKQKKKCSVRVLQFIMYMSAGVSFINRKNTVWMKDIYWCSRAEILARRLSG